MKKILIVVDYQYDFVDPKGALSIPGADKIWKNIQQKINSNDYENVIYTFDTHTKKQYFGSDEQQIFPDIHCEYGTKGWDLFKIKPQNDVQFRKQVESFKTPFSSIVIGNEYFFTKDVFDIWKGNEDYPKWFQRTFPKDEYEIDVVGVATNYCVFMNVDGMIDRGYKINLLTDGVKGIETFPDGSVDPSLKNSIEIMEKAGVSFKG